MSNDEIIHIDDECIVCFERSNTSSTIHSSQSQEIKCIFDFDCSCNYMIHRECYIRWLEYNRNPHCIICRKGVVLYGGDDDYGLQLVEEPMPAVSQCLCISFSIICILCLLLSYGMIMIQIIS